MAKYLPGFEVVGIVGWDDLIVRDSDRNTYRVPSVPMHKKYLEPYSVPPNASDVENDDRFAGRVKWYVQPLVFGGSPSDDENMTWINLDQHPEVVVWWNEKYQESVGASANDQQG